MATQPVPEGYHTVTPYLVVKDVQAVLTFAATAFDAETTLTMPEPDGRITHAEMRIGDSMVMVGEPRDPAELMPAMLNLYLGDVDAAYERALDAGATSLKEPVDEFYGDRTGGVQDAVGNKWYLATRVEDLTSEEMRRRGAEAEG